MDIPEDISHQDIITALDSLERLKEQEADSNHKESIERIRQLIKGIFEFERDKPTNEDLKITRDVIDSIDSERQSWHDEEYVKEQKEIGLS